MGIRGQTLCSPRSRAPELASPADFFFLLALLEPQGASQSHPEPCGSTVLGFRLSCPLHLPPKPDLGLGF